MSKSTQKDICLKSYLQESGKGLGSPIYEINSKKKKHPLSQVRDWCQWCGRILVLVLIYLIKLLRTLAALVCVLKV